MILHLRPSLRSRRAKRKQRVFSSRSCVQAAAAAAGPARTALNRFVSPAIKRHGADALASLLMRGVLPWHVHRSIPDKSRGSRRLVRPPFCRFRLSAAIHCCRFPARRHPTWKVAAWRAALRLPAASRVDAEVSVASLSPTLQQQWQTLKYRKKELGNIYIYVFF